MRTVEAEMEQDKLKKLLEEHMAGVMILFVYGAMFSLDCIDRYFS